MQQSLVHMFLERAKQDPARAALQFKKDGCYSAITYENFAARVRHFALGLNRLGVAKGDRVCLLSENRPEWAIADLGILSLGAVNVPIYPTSSDTESEYILKHCEATVLILSSADQCRKILGIKNNCAGLKHLIVMDTLPGHGADIMEFDDILAGGEEEDRKEPAAYERLCEKVHLGDLATLIYTSGTTGQPKGAMLTHMNFLSNALSCATVIPAQPGDSCLSYLPLSHVFERMAGYYFMIYQGVTIAYAESIDTVPQNLIEIKPTVMTSVPRLYEKMYARIFEQVHSSPVKTRIFEWSIKAGKDSSPFRMAGSPLPFMLGLKYGLAQRLVFKKIKEKLGGRLRFFISGGAPLSKEIAEFFYAADILILEGYGLTETSPVISVNRPDSFKFGTVGPLLPGVEVKIADDGEILVKGPNIMQGYYKDAEKTSRAIRDRWFATGDIGELDPKGFLKITDRKKDIIITSGGKNIAPQKIENLLVADESILQICVCGEAKNYITALIVPNFTRLESFAREQGISAGTREELVRNPKVIEWMRQRIDTRARDLAGYEKIKYFTLLSEEFTQDKGEMTPTLKLKRKAINEKYRALIEAMYEGKTYSKQNPS